jgi:hypothetical protein
VQPRTRSQASLLARATPDRGAAAVTELWHFSEDPGLSRFEPRDGKVWAIDEAHSWLYWFPRDCPRATYWAVAGQTAQEDVERRLDGDRERRIAVIETAWLERMHAVQLYGYRMPSEPFDEVLDNRFYVASTPVEALERVKLGDLVERHRAAGIDFRDAAALYPLWDEVIETTLEFSGIRLRNAVRA